MKILLGFVLFMMGNHLVWSQGEFKAYEETIPNSELAFEMVPVKGGEVKTVIAGSEVEVEVTSFWMATNELTYDEYTHFMQDETFSQNETMDAITRPSPPYIDFTLGMGKEGGFPANSMSLYGAMMYCKWLYNKTGHFYRPPTEAEWQMACEAGQSTSEDDLAVTADNSNNAYTKVGQKAANKLGIHDMLGNVAEWTIDAYTEDYKAQLAEVGSEDPVLVPVSRKSYVTLKGGHFRSPAAEVSCAMRIKSDKLWNRRDPQIPKSRWWNTDAPFIGFRLVRPNVEMTEEEIEAFYAQYIK
ncbi:formylglycine-generating enzyme family protein [Membranihabitans marinus]|uniref:formylglycine-generating enzyme family protein n=1 Tax=Membranihabitans marinus TaxID=1227546 RepID=UPI001F32E1F1|nr:SUMF1/EgtB/PvdO family nonheme iron enzyme [Membranihabitans marinus]